jgi:hypothetical protein
MDHKGSEGSGLVVSGARNRIVRPIARHSIITWALLLPAALLVRRPPETASSGQPEAMAVAPAFPPLSLRSRKRLQVA